MPKTRRLFAISVTLLGAALIASPDALAAGGGMGGHAMGSFGASLGNSSARFGSQIGVGSGAFNVSNHAMFVTGSRLPVTVNSSIGTTSSSASTSGSASVGSDTASGNLTFSNHGSMTAASHMSANGLANTNGPNATMRVFGKARAAARHALHLTRLSSKSH